MRFYTQQHPYYYGLALSPRAARAPIGSKPLTHTRRSSVCSALILIEASPLKAGLVDGSTILNE